MTTATLSTREENRPKALITSLIFHAVLVVILFLYRFEAQEAITEAPGILVPLNIEWGGGGDNVAAGLPDEGQGNDPAPQGEQMSAPTANNKPADLPDPNPPAPSPPVRSTPTTPTSSSTTDDPNVAALRKQQEDTKRKEQQEVDEKRRKQEASDQARLAEENRKKQEAADREAQKGKFGSAFGSGPGTGSGNTGKPGNQGSPTGTGDNPFGKSSGSGGGTDGGIGTGDGPSIGGGLSGRKVVGRPTMVDKTQQTGRVVIEICVDASGKVFSADFTQKGSTTNNSDLQTKAKQWASQHKFAASTKEKDCGTITFNFQVK